MSNKKVKQQLIKLFGKECFIDKLHLRKENEPRKYTSKAKKKRMKQLTYHHIKEKSKGGKTTITNRSFIK